MDDTEIIDLYMKRNEKAISESNAKYGRFCFKVAFNVLDNREDSDECVNDTWFRSWNAIPPRQPKFLSAFFAKITRNLAVNKLESLHAYKRGNGSAWAAIDELEECVASSSDTEAEFSMRILEEDINRFLKAIPQRDCDIFLRRYFYVDTTREIAQRYGIKESNVLLILSRTRKKLREYLIKEGYVI